MNRPCDSATLVEKCVISRRSLLGAIVNTCHSISARLLKLIIVGCTATILPTMVVAQQRLKYSFSAIVPGKYIEQHVLEVGDIPGHQIRVAALNTKYGDEAPVFDGTKVTESSGWISSDYINGSGRFLQYSILQMANGDRIYQNIEGQSHTSVSSDGGKRTTYTTVTLIRGGTGKFSTIRGILKGSGATDFKTGPVNNSVEGEYWFEK